MVNQHMEKYLALITAHAMKIKNSLYRFFNLKSK